MSIYDPELPNGFQDADFEMRDLEAAGRAAGRKRARATRFYAAGDFAKAAACCSHGGGYPLKSLCAENCADPNAGEAGYRCTDCGSRLSNEPWGQDFTVLCACEIKGRL